MFFRFVFAGSLVFSFASQRAVGQTHGGDRDKLEEDLQVPRKDEDDYQMSSKSKKLLKEVSEEIKKAGSFHAAVEKDTRFAKSFLELLHEERKQLECDWGTFESSDEDENSDRKVSDRNEESSASDDKPISESAILKKVDTPDETADDEDDSDGGYLSHPDKDFAKVLVEFAKAGRLRSLGSAFQKMPRLSRVQLAVIFRARLNCVDGAQRTSIYNDPNYSASLIHEDFKSLSKDIADNKNKIIFSSDTHVYDFKDPELKEKAEAAAELFTWLSPRAMSRPNSAEAKAFQKEFQQWFLKDERTTNISSRSDVIDVLGHFVGQNRRLHNSVNKSNMLGSLAIKNYFEVPQKPATFTASRGIPLGSFKAFAEDIGGEVEDDAGYEGYGTDSDFEAEKLGNLMVLSCLGGQMVPLDPSPTELRMIGGDEHVHTLSFSGGEQLILDGPFFHKQLSELGYEKIEFLCGSEKLTMKLSELKPEKQKALLNIKEDPTTETSSRHFNYGPDKRIRAVMTVGLIEETDAKLLAGIKLLMAAKGFEFKSAEAVEDLKKDFSSEFKKADLYMPIGHSITVSDFTLGSDKGQRIVFEKKKDGGKIVEMVLFIPPVDPAIGSENRAVSLTGKEASKILADRYRDGEEPPFIVNISCDSGQTAKGWTYAHGIARETLGCVGPGIKPVVFGADRGFGTDSPLEIAGHMKHPLAALAVAENEGSAEDLFKVLKQTGYKPIANFGETEGLSGTANGEADVIRVTDSTGKELVY
jgi:hypothetical protein